MKMEALVNDLSEENDKYYYYAGNWHIGSLDLTTITDKPFVVVGISGSDNSINALNWAVERARRTDANLLLVCVAQLASYMLTRLSVDTIGYEKKSFLEYARQTIDVAIEHIGDINLNIYGIVQVGEPIGVIRDLSKAAQLMVVGSGENNSFTGRLRGSVATHIPAHCLCPLVVVPGDFSDKAVTGKIVVGVDGSAHCIHTLEVALTEAKCWNAELIAMSIFHPVANFTWWPANSDKTSRLEEARAGLAAIVGGVIKSNMQIAEHIKVGTHALEGDPKELLPEFSTAVDLLVVGNRGVGGFAGMMLGSTSRAVLENSLCPVMVVPSHTENSSTRPLQVAWI